MAKVTINGGLDGIRVIVDNDTVNDITVGAGESKEVEFKGKAELRVLSAASAVEGDAANPASGA